MSVVKETISSALVVIRHGDTKYTEQFPDLTGRGIKQITDAAESLQDFIDRYDVCLPVTSPRARARGSAHFFLKALDLADLTPTVSRRLRSVDFKDFEKYLSYDNSHNTDIYGQMWLTDPFLAGENDIMESRRNVDVRSHRALAYYSARTHFLAQAGQLSICRLLFTHFEVSVNALKGLFTTAADYPIQNHEAPRNGEAVVLKLEDIKPSIVTIAARGMERKARHRPLLKRFDHLTD